MIRGLTPSELHKDLAYVPGEVNLWPQLSGGGDRPARPPARGWTRSGDNATWICSELDPTKKARTYSGQPPEGCPGCRPGQ